MKPEQLTVHTISRKYKKIHTFFSVLRNGSNGTPETLLVTVRIPSVEQVSSGFEKCVDVLSLPSPSCDTLKQNTSPTT